MILAHHEAGTSLLPCLIAGASYALFAARLWLAERRLKQNRPKESDK